MFLLRRPKVLLSLITCASVIRPPTVSCAFTMSTATTAGPQVRGVNVEKFLFADYEPRGGIITNQDNIELYRAGRKGCKNGVIVIPDTMGWNGGRIRNLADFFGDNDCIAVIPNISGTSIGGYGGPSYFETKGLADYMKSLMFEGNIKPKIASTIQTMRDEGVENIALIGFSWGGWVATNILASELSNDIVCAALPHPSINLEERVYGGSLLELMGRVNRPVLLMPAKGDPDDYRLILKLLKYKLPSSDVIDYHNIDHGFLLRGTVNDPEIKEACQKSLSEILSYFQHHFRMDAKDLVANSAKGGFTQEQWQRSKGFLERTKETGARAVERAQQSASDLTHGVQDSTQHTYDAAKETSSSWADRFKEVGSAAVEKVQQAGHYVGETIGIVGEKTEDAYEQTKTSAGQTMEKAKDVAGQTYDKAKENVNYVGGKAGETYEKAKDVAGQTYEHSKDTAGQYYDKAKDTAGNMTEKAKQTSQDVGQRASETYEQTKDAAGQYYEKAKDTANDMGERAKQTGQQVGQKAQESYDKAKGSAQDMSERAKQTTNDASQRAQESYDKTKDKAKESASETGQQFGEKMKQTGETIKQRSAEKSPKNTYNK